MKKIFLLFTFYFLLFTLSAQIQFNKVDDELELPNMRNVFQMADTGYVMVGGSYHNNKIKIDVNFYDSLGDFVWNKYYGDDIYNYYHGIEGACIKTDGGYILAGSSHYSNQDTSMIYLVKFDESFDTLWTKKYFKDTNFVVTRSICNTNDGGFLIVGETELNNDSVWTSDNTKGLMLKVDADGNYEWFKSYGTDEHHDNFYKATQTHDGGYLVGGWTKSWQDGLAYVDQGDWYIVKTDSQGNEQWNRRYGNPIYDDYRISQILRASDTTYYITGAWTYDRNSTGSTVYQESHIIKLDKDFNEVYELKYDNQAYFQSYIMAAIETADSNILLAGSRSDDDAVDWYWPRATLHKITPDGDIIWQRQYVAEHDTVNGDHKGYSVKQTSDGGYIIGGWVNNSTILSPSQQLWLVKTDSLGCDGTGDFWDCSTGVQIREFASNPDFYMYPNPAKDYVVIASSSLSSPLSGVEGEVEGSILKIYNLSGQLVKSFPLVTERSRSVGETGKVQIPISDLKSGVYFVKVGKQMKKLVVE